MQPYRMRSMWHWMRGALAGWRLAKMRRRSCPILPLSENIGTSNLRLVELKRPCSSATARARLVIELWRTKNCIPVFKGNDVSRAIRFRRDNQKRCRVVGAFIDGGVVYLVASAFHT